MTVGHVKDDLEPAEGSHKKEEQSGKHERKEDAPAGLDRQQQSSDTKGPTIVMAFIVLFLIIVVGFIFWPRDGMSIVFRSQGGPAAFDATSALSYADRVSRIAEITVGGVLTLALGLVGFSWISTNARIERDRQELSDHKDSLEKEFERRFKEVERQLNEAVADVRRIRRSIDDRIEGRVSVASSATRSYVDRQINEVLSRELFKLRESSRVQSPRGSIFIDDLIQDEKYDEAFQVFTDTLQSVIERINESHGKISPDHLGFVIRNSVRPRNIWAVTMHLDQVDKRLIREYGDDLKATVIQFVELIRREPRLIRQNVIREQYESVLSELNARLEERLMMDSPPPATEPDTDLGS
jgi:hypothetical protein